MLELIASCVMCLVEPPLTVAESSGWKATSRYEDVVKMVDALASATANVRRISLGKTSEGRDIPVLVYADPPVATAQDAANAKEAGKLVVLAIGNIHAGEVDGKEALLMLARSIGDGEHPDWLKKAVIAIAPIYNADGNERFSKTSRPGQVGPEEGQGQRENGQGFDLNRDFIKVECPETQGLVRFMAEWDPHLFIDTHTTDGSFHQYHMTYCGPKAPPGSALVAEFTRTQLFPEVSHRFGLATGWKSFFYGNFEDEFERAPETPRSHTRWETFPAEGRYGTTYVGLRNRMSVLTESYSYASYKDRVIATNEFVKAVLDVATGDKDQIREILRVADEQTIRAGESPRDGDTVALRTKMVSSGTVTIPGFVERIENGRSIPTGERAQFVCEHFDRFESTLSVPRPWGYYLPKECDAIKDVLVRHGIAVESVDTDFDAATQGYVISSSKQASRRFQGHVLVTIDASIEQTKTAKCSAGGWVVKTGQRLGTLVVYLLEPGSEDGVGTWNYYDPWLKDGAKFPVLRIATALERKKNADGP
ncbi:MAG: M14 family metallopeptidase [Planctomycetes bacterium]|nr:M14 family metallopeptidase [Planctomycetota bacterium]